jgi:hypothetical protein
MEMDTEGKPEGREEIEANKPINSIFVLNISYSNKITRKIIATYYFK